MFCIHNDVTGLTSEYVFADKADAEQVIEFRTDGDDLRVVEVTGEYEASVKARADEHERRANAAREQMARNREVV